jgi:rhamnose utilization protein RhaD (predicted bifunctional aldolase and dehydrogenase)
VPHYLAVMQSLWNDRDAAACQSDPLSLRAYTSRLLGGEPSLVLHGGGNTSVKANLKNLFGDSESVLLIKGSGWDLTTMAEAGFAPVRMDGFKRMAELLALSDSEMVKAERGAMLDPNAPTSSIGAILHAIIPYPCVDHTHADAVVTLTDAPGGERRVPGD